ncbi:MAG TPA: TIGR01777 family oxidoreductase [Chloroflexota bacterium]|jgi:hypothetical protein|nr:TIGR01777 family oxidoreductase [Chloroflexota bacterium]
MNIVLTGATGFIGRSLARRLAARGDTVTALTRNVEQARSHLPKEITVFEWRPPAPSPGWAKIVAESDAVVNLAGEPIADRRWSAAQKAKIHQSRVDATAAIVSAMGESSQRQPVLVNGSAIGYYGPRGSDEITETTGPGDDFLAGVVVAWEAAALAAEAHGARVVLIRTGLVLGTDGGALPRLLLPFKLFSGGLVGPAHQWVSWVHIDDELELIVTALDNQAFSGPINATAPNPVTMREFSRAIGAVLHRPVWAPGLPVAMKLVLGERTEVVFASQRVLPMRAEDLGFQFAHPVIGEALTSLLARG